MPILQIRYRNPHRTPRCSYTISPSPRTGRKIVSPFEDSPKPAFVQKFEFVGTTDNSPYFAISDALSWRASIGGEAAIMAYQQSLSLLAGRRAASILGTEILDNAQGTLTQCAMCNVRLPLDKDEVLGIMRRGGFPEMGEAEVGKHVRSWLTEVMFKRHDTFMQLTVLYGGSWWWRLSAAVYSGLDEFEWGARVLGKECGRIRGGAMVEWMKTRAKL
jgi:hercynylcysteine S-oxide lyase